MDRSWMLVGNRLLPEYANGVNEFLKFAIDHMDNENTIRCPCYKCNNCYWLTPDQVRDHLIIHGIVKVYNPWVYHGEMAEAISDSETYNDDIDDVVDDDVDLVGDGTWDMLQELNHESLFNDWAASSTSNSAAGDVHIESNSFAKLFIDATQPLYSGCKMSKLSFIVRLLHLKIINKWTNKSFTMLLELLNTILPSDAQVPPNFYNAKKVIRELGLYYEKIDACKNDCILFRKEYAHLDACPTCNSPRYKPGSDGTNTVPEKVLRYFPLTPRLQRLFISSKTAEDMRWHSNMRVKDGLLRHPADSKAWKHLDQQYPLFASDPRNVRLGLSSDGFNPFNNMSNSYSIWPVFTVPYNLPPWRCMKDPFMMLSLLIPGPKGPGNNIDVYLKPLVDELNDLWDNGVQTYDASMDQLFQLHAALLWTINDFPAYGNLSGWSTKGKLACPVCNKDASFHSLTHGSKTCYMGHRRFLHRDHKWRNHNRFDGREHRSPPTLLSGEDVLAQLNVITQPIFGEPYNRSKKRKRAASDLHWTKKSIFFQLPYWKDLQLRHNLDVMHIEKNVCDSVVGTIMNIEGKTKDTLKTRLDLEAMGMMHDLHPIRRDGAIFLPPACYMLNIDEKKKFCEFLSSVKLPDGYASNIAKCVNLRDYNISGLKSHDCHVLMQRLLPIALRGFLRKDVTKALIDLCIFFRELTSRTLKVDVLQQLESNIALVLSKLETIFPPAFFDIMVHLPIHLAREAMIAGPCQYRWMYPFERYMHNLKGYVRNKARPEGSIAEGYIDNECLTFCSMYFDDMESKFNRPERNLDVGDAQSSSELSVFQQKARGLGAATNDELNLYEWAKIRWYVLNNCSDVLPYLNEHRELLERENVGDIFRKQQVEFPRWFLKRLIEMESQGIFNGLDDLKKLARGPDKAVVRYAGCIINGYRFRTIKRDMHIKTQNSGIVVKGEHNGAETNFFGVLNDVIELTFLGQKKVFMFKCNWWDSGHRSRIHVDEFGFLSVNVTKTWYKDDPYILASQAEEVIYIPDTKLGKNWRVVERMQPRNIFDAQVMKPTDDGETEPFQQDECNEIDSNATIDEFVQPLNRIDMDDIMIDGNAAAYPNLGQGSSGYNNDDDDGSLRDDNSENEM